MENHVGNKKQAVRKQGANLCSHEVNEQLVRIVMQVNELKSEKPGGFNEEANEHAMQETFYTRSLKLIAVFFAKLFENIRPVTNGGKN